MADNIFFIIAGENYKEYYYNAFGAKNMNEYIFWGPETTMRYIRNSNLVKDFEAIRDNFGGPSAGVLLDLDNRVLMFYGGEITFDIPLRRMYLSLIKFNYPGWKVKWATEGISDIADFTGIGRENAVFPKIPEKTKKSKGMSLDKNSSTTWIDSILSVSKNGKIRIYPFNGYGYERLIYLGPKILKATEKVDGFDNVNLDKWTKSFPYEGVHVTLDDRGATPVKKVSFWTSMPQENIMRRAVAAWSDYTVVWHADNYEFQIKETRGHLQMPVAQEWAEINEVKAMVCGSESKADNWFEAIEELVLEEEGHRDNFYVDYNGKLAFGLSRKDREIIFDENLREYLMSIEE